MNEDVFLVKEDDEAIVNTTVMGSLRKSSIRASLQRSEQGLPSFLIGISKTLD